MPRARRGERALRHPAIPPAGKLLSAGVSDSGAPAERRGVILSDICAIEVGIVVWEASAEATLTILAENAEQNPAQAGVPADATGPSGLKDRRTKTIR